MKLIEKISLLKWEPYTEKYFFNIEDLYRRFDGKQAINKPSRWEFSTEKMKKHEIGLT